MFRIIHSADWQLGARFSQFGPLAPRLREARLETLRRALGLARQHAADAFLIAGDLFEDNQVADALVADVIELFRAHPDVPVFILPGNHDPHSGPDCVWQRKAFLAPGFPAHVRVLREACALEIGARATGGGATSEKIFLLASPLHQKRSTSDPSLKLAELAAALPPGALKIGVTHGSLAIESRHQPDDFPIALNAASHAGLDCLAIGHWHNWLAGTDGGRILMPGTPEPDRFANDDSGNIALVEFDAPGRPPRVQKLPVATLAWRELVFDFIAPDEARAALAAALDALAPEAARTVLRITLRGAADPAALTATLAWLETARAPFLASQIADDTQPALNSAQLDDLRARHPILAQVLADIDRLEALATGAISPLAPTGPDAPPETPPEDAPPASAPLSPQEINEKILAPSKLELAALTPALFTRLRRTLLQNIQEVSQ